MTNRHNIAEILLNVALNTITLTPNSIMTSNVKGKSLMINTVNKQLLLHFTYFFSHYIGAGKPEEDGVYESRLTTMSKSVHSSGSRGLLHFEFLYQYRDIQLKI